jgi:aryl-alcohol dehydrogenase-like predicted oxidoreductase
VLVEAQLICGFFAEQAIVVSVVVRAGWAVEGAAEGIAGTVATESMLDELTPELQEASARQRHNGLRSRIDGIVASDVDGWSGTDRGMARMKYVKLGSTGLDVSTVCLGCMSYGEPGRGAHPWTLDEETSRPFIKDALEAGINFFDTANVYSDGSSEEIVGRALADFANRDEIVLATKVHGRMRSGPNGGGLSRKAIMHEIDASLRRLGTDYVDLYQIHRWDPLTPIEETIEALHDVVKAGKALHLGASSMYAWQFSKALHVADLNGWTRFATMQNHYNLLYREEEREMLPLCLDQGIGVIPWSPLARGLLTRDWNSTSARSETDEFGRTLYRESDQVIVEEVARIAEARGVTRAQVALAWVSSHPAVDAPIVGATKPQHLQDAVGSLDVLLTADEIKALEASYTPRAIAGH